ncbi:apolipoprotein N-acyltransferase [Propionicicella superfundia]|uniref:apolipoprotein N-acyltransferase n=1 Tax=Propionicicella superfundia TaxID=348582 RepID=UPI0012EC5161|nr:apolipoprotein N-acyltransferase [Propionicicella superfundia]
MLRWSSSLRPWPRRVLILASGVLVGLAFQPFDIVPALFVGVPLLTILLVTTPDRPSPAATTAVRRMRRRLHWPGFGAGYLFGLGFLTVTVSWVRAIHPLVPIPLIAFEALWFGGLGVAIRLLHRLPAWPLWTAGAWSLVEFGYSRFPFGGFGWVRLAYAVVDTPLSGFLPLVGVAGVSYLAALSCQVLAWAALATRGALLRVAAVAAALALFLTGLAGRLYQPAATSETVDVGFVQGNVDGAGIEALGRARSVTNNHLSETITLIARSRTGEQPQPDFILWPENSTDIDPTTDPVTEGVVETAVRLAGVPILVGAVTDGPGADQRQTVGIWWDPEDGPTATHYKRNLVPFGEYIPFRSLLLPVFPILQRVGRDSVPGTDSGILDVTLPDGRRLAIGDAICFELAYDDTMYALGREADILVVQSNNATYRGTGQPEQQFAITRARAMESRHEILVATTNSLSGFIGADGTVHAITSEGTAASGVFTMPVRDTVTPAVVVAPWIDLGLAVATVAGLCVAVAVGAARRRAGTMDHATPRTPD